MPRFLAIEWDAREARVAVARTRGASAVVEHAFAVDLGGRDAAQPVSEAHIGQKVAAALAARGVGRCETLVAVGRANIELRQLTLPLSPLDELPDLVRFQALRQFTTIGEDWPLDFVHVDTGEAESFSVLAAAIAPDMVAQIETTCRAAELAPKRLILRPFSAASLLRRHHSATPQPIRLMVDLLAEEADLTVLVDEYVFMVRTVRLASADDAAVISRALLGEIRRTIASAQNQLKGRRVEKVVLCGDGRDQTLLKESIETELSLAVELFDPFGMLELDAAVQAARPQHAGRFTPLLGMLADEAQGAAHPIDFLHPRKRPEAPSQNRRYALVGGIVAAAGLAAVLVVWIQLRALDSEIADLTAEQSSKKKQVAAATESKAKADAVEEFLASDFTWLDELQSLSQTLPSAEEAIISQLNFSTRQPGGQIAVDGFAREHGNIVTVRSALQAGGRSVLSTGTTQDDKRDEYRWRFKETMLLAPAAPAPTTTPATTPVTKPAAETPESKPAEKPAVEAPESESAEKPATSESAPAAPVPTTAPATKPAVEAPESKPAVAVPESQPDNEPAAEAPETRPAEKPAAAESAPATKEPPQ